MKIVNHLLFNDDNTPVRFEAIPNYSKTARILAHEYLVLHFTGGMNVPSVVTWFKNPAARVSAHLLIGRDGSLVQFVPFDTVAWHAGDSIWADRTGINKYSIGIEMDNAGDLRRVGSKWMLGNNIVPDDQVIIKTHKLEYAPRGWHIYTPQQMETCQQVVKLLFAQYKFLDLIGHEDISLSGKIDPGPAFPMDEFRLEAFGLQPGNEVYYTTVIPIYLRSGPSDRYPVTGKYLKIGTRVVVLERLRGWVNVCVEESGVKGWLPERRMKRVPTQPKPVEPDKPPEEPPVEEPPPTEPEPPTDPTQPPDEPPVEEPPPQEPGISTSAPSTRPQRPV